MHKILILLALIVLIGSLFRITFLSSIPNGFWCDEANVGYDAYSMLKTGRDQYGQFMPLFSNDFGLGRNESLQRFILIPFIKIFGLNEFGVRFSSALIGIFTIIILYFLGKEMFNQKVGLISAFLLAISPWHIQFSRIAFQAIITPFFFCLALYYFLKFLNNSKYLVLSAVFFSASLYTYSSARVFIPIFMFCLSLIFIKLLWREKNITIISLIIILSVLVPLSTFWLSPQGMMWANTQLKLSFSKNIEYYLSYISPNFLFFKGDPFPRHSVGKMGELYYFEILSVLIGLIYVLKNYRNKKYWILYIWLLLYPIPAALTAEGHATRSLCGGPLFALISGYGLYMFVTLFKDKKIKNLVIISLSVIIFINIIYYAKRLFIDYPRESTIDWQYGIREAIHLAEHDNYDYVLVSNSNYYNYFNYLNKINILFYTKFPPEQCQINIKSGNQFHFGKYYFLDTSQRNIKFKGKGLYIILPGEINKIPKDLYNIKIKKIITDYYGFEHLELVEVTSKI